MSSGLSRVGERPPALDTSLAPPSSHYNNGLSAPMTPMTPASPSAKRKTNPLQDLMETEKIYVDRLTGIIRKVASAWSRSNLPPPELDKMFRGIEAIYKSNRSLLAKLNELGGADPALADPKALGDLLMKWIDDLTTPYSNYCNKFMVGFDTWSPVQSNSRLPSTLATFSATHPPPLPAGSDPHPSEPPLWSLDALFILPRHRLKYYRKLYGRLLKSTTEGRSDYRLLVDAVEKLDMLMHTLDDRSSVDVASIAPPPPVEMEDEVVMDMRQARESSTAQIVSPNTIPSPRASSTSSGGQPSNDGRFRASSRASTGTISMPISDLERRLATDRCIDIFTMKPKSVRLQITPPSLAHTRELLLSADVTITVTPRVTGVEVVHGKGHIYILSDLFLIGERMTAEERAAWPSGGPDTWLCYPPLAGKHLRLSDSKNQSNSFQITIMKKETFTIVTESPDMKELAMSKFKECITAAANLAAAAKAREAPPMPSLDSMIRPSPAVSPVPSTSQIGSGVGTPVSDRALSPAASVTSPLSFNPERRFSPPSQAPSQYEGRTSRSSSLHSGPPGRGSLQADYPPSDLPALPTGPPHMGAQFPPPPPPPEKPTWDQRMSDDMMAPPPRAPFAAPDRPGSAPLPNNQMPPNFQQGPPQAFGPGQMYNQPGMNNGGPGPYGGRPPGPPGPGGMGPPPPQMQHPGPYGHPQMRNATMPNDPRFQGQPPGPGMYASGSLGGPPMPPHADHGMRRAASSGALATQFERASLNGPRPPMPPMQGGVAPGGLYAPQARMLLPSALQDRVVSSVGAPNPDAADDDSPPTSPRMSAEAPTGPVTSTIIEQGKCKIFHQQHHQAWKSLGTAHLQLFHMQPTNVKQLVVQADDKKRSLIISTLVLSDGVERVGKTGIAVSLSDKGVRTGIVYMVQLKNESAANQLFDKLILGSDRRLR